MHWGRLLPPNRVSRNGAPFLWPRPLCDSAWAKLLSALLCAALLLPAGCGSANLPPMPSVKFTRVPPSGSGPESLERISGRVEHAPAGVRVVLYARSQDTWWIQPFRSRGITGVAADGSWSNATHLGTDYAALVVNSTYQPAARLSTLPAVNGNILATAVTKASSEPAPRPKLIEFSGYEWMVRSSPDDRGGDLCDYEPANVWVDDHGYLHLLMGQEEGRWHCAGIALTRSLGYGTYKFVVADSAHLPASAVLSMYTRDPDGAEMDIELSRWGKMQSRNADYVVQPYYVPENTTHFDVPAGRMTHILRWEPGSAGFKSLVGTPAVRQPVVAEHVFKSGVPVPAKEKLHLAFYDFHHSQSGLQHPVEIVVQKFEYLP